METELLGKPKPRIIIFGASGFVGSALVRRFSEDGFEVLAVVRKLSRMGSLPGQPVVMDLDGPPSNDSPIMPGDIVVQACYMPQTQHVVELCPPDIQKLVIIGSALHLSQIADPVVKDVRDAMTYLEGVDLPWVVLHPTMIYGSDDTVGLSENRPLSGIQRIKNMITRLPVVPLPRFGRALIQPIHIEDVYSCAQAAIEDGELTHVQINIAGAQPLPLKVFIQKLAQTIKKGVWVVPLPSSVLLFVGRLLQLFPRFPQLSELEIRKLSENRDVDTSQMIECLKVKPRDFDPQ